MNVNICNVSIYVYVLTTVNSQTNDSLAIIKMHKLNKQKNDKIYLSWNLDE